MYRNLYVTAILTGKELFNFNAALFVDDESALDAAQEDIMNQEMIAQREEEERRAEEEIERAQERQNQLREAEIIEEAYRLRRIQEWREAAAARKLSFLFGDVTVNEIVFSWYLDEVEDLSLFAEISADDSSEVEILLPSTVGLDMTFQKVETA